MKDQIHSLENQVLIIDCGSTTTKALYFEREGKNPDSGQSSDQWKLTTDINTPTTVESPNNDVTIGVNKAINHLKESSTSYRENGSSCPILVTSSAGGGLQIVVLGLSQEISSTVSSQVALNAGAIVSLSLSMDDSFSFADKVSKLQAARPDLVILAGGFSGAAPAAMMELLAVLKEARLKPRYGTDYKVPVIYCGTEMIFNEIRVTLEDLYDLTSIPNICPKPESVNSRPVLDKIQDLFLSSVMQHAPGYNKLSNLVNAPILPTPQSVNMIIDAFAKTNQLSVLAVDIGGATTDVYTAHVSDNYFVQRSVSANIGMSYSAAAVLKDSSISEIAYYCRGQASDSDIETYIWNKTIKPTVPPTDPVDILIEQALCRVALKLAYKAHKKLCGTQKKKLNYHICIASGGVLSHAPDDKLIPWIMSDGFNLVGICEIAVDKIFMLPHLGAMLEIDKASSMQILKTECLNSKGFLVSAVSKKKFSTGTKIASLFLKDKHVDDITYGERRIIEIPNIDLSAKTYSLTLKPSNRHVDCGAGFGNPYSVNLKPLNISSQLIQVYLDGGHA